MNTRGISLTVYPESFRRMSSGRWRLIPYVAESGRIPVHEFLDQLELDDPERYDYFQNVLRPLLEEHGPGLGEPAFKRLPATDFCEVRWSGPNRAHYRIYCSVEPDRKLVLYHGVVKRWRRFEKDDQTICRNRCTDYHTKQYNANERIKQRARAQVEE